MNSLHEPKKKSRSEEAWPAEVDPNTAAYHIRGRPIFLPSQLQPPDKDAGKRTTPTNGEAKSYKASFAIAEDAPKIRTLDLRLAAADSDLGNKIKKAFELAKSAGQELNLEFSHTTFSNEV